MVQDIGNFKLKCRVNFPAFNRKSSANLHFERIDIEPAFAKCLDPTVLLKT